MTIRRTALRSGAILGAAGLLTLSLSAPASAHVTVTASETGAGAYSVLTFQVGHGCDGSPTTTMTIQMPEEIIAVTPTRNSLWQVKKTMTKLAEPITDAHGNTVTERVGEVVYTARQPLPEGYRDTFELSLQLPETAGETLAFPVVQTCAKGETGWVEVPADGQDAEELEHPAPTVTITEADGEGDHHGDDASDADDAADVPDNEGDDRGDSDAAADDNDEGGNGVGYAGLGLGALGAVLGGAALARTRKQS